MPLASAGTSRTVVVEVTNRFPITSHARPRGASTGNDRAGLPSPEDAAMPTPSTVVIVFVAAIDDRHDVDTVRRRLGHVDATGVRVVSDSQHRAEGSVAKSRECSSRNGLRIPACDHPEPGAAGA